MNGDKLETSSLITQLGLSISSNLTWKPHIYFIAKYASQKLGFLSRARGYASPSQLLTIYKSQIRPILEYCSHAWGGAPKSSLHLLDRVQSKAICLINNRILTNFLVSLRSLSCWRYFHFLPPFSRTLLSENQKHYSWFSEACLNHQRLYLFTPFPSYIT